MFCAGAAAFALAAVAPAASAMTVVKAFIGGPFSLVNPLGSIPATKLLKGNTYDFTFTMVQPLKAAISSTQVSAQLLAHSASTPEIIQYSLYSGAPGSGSFVSQSTLDYSPTITFRPEVGAYFLQVDVVKRVGETVGGTLTTAPAPEPAAWAMMLLGFGALGGVMRRRGVSLA
jgi:hypothetical protein